MSISDNFHAPIIVNPVRWEPASNGFVPTGAVCGGKTFAGEPLFIGRTKLIENRDELTPGVLIPSEGCLTVSFATGVRKSAKYEVLVTSDPRFVHWVSCECGQVPLNAVIGGIDSSYLEPLYIGKTTGHMSLGRTWRGHRLSDGPHELCSIDESEFGNDEDYLNDKESSSTSLLSGHAELEYATNLVSYPGKVHCSHKCLYVPYNGKEYIFRNYQVLILTSCPAALSVICKCSIRDQIFNAMLERKELGKRTPRTCSSMLVPGFDEFTELEEKIDTLPLPSKTCSSMLVPEFDEFTELEEKIDTLPLPSKLKLFCKQAG